LERSQIALGRNLYKTLPEDEYDQQPVLGGDGRFLLVADIRIDNRAELIAEMRIGAAEAAGLADSALLMRAIERWGEAVVDHLSGDFAFALWDELEQRLLLARDPTGQRPLHYFSGNGLFAFASMPQALWAVPGVPAEADPPRMAELIAELRPPPNKTYYKEIFRVQSGHIVAVDQRGVRERCYWSPPLRQLRLSSDDEYVEMFRDAVDSAVRARLRGTDGVVATHLSAGYDSNTVTATAARLLSSCGGKVLAFTSAPREGFDGTVPRGRVADESPYAALTAALYPNIEHIIVRSSGKSQLDLLDETHAFAQYPVGQLSNNVWWSAINAEASRRGARVLLTGQAGNHTVSAPGIVILADLIREGRWRDWWREARLLPRRSPMRVRGVLAKSFGPWLPKPLWLLLNAVFLGSSLRANTPHLLSAHWASLIDNSVNPGRDTIPPRDTYRLRRELLQNMDPGTFRKSALAQWGVDERDPTADSRLITFCLSLPYDQLLKNGLPRPLARRALSDRLSSTILESAPRGYQMADWYEPLTPERLRKELEIIRESEFASSLLNVERLASMIENWPTSDLNGNKAVQEYRFAFLLALSAAHFVRTLPMAASRREKLRPAAKIDVPFVADGP
jgi:asparagine synthase (glutamine-hydrolysing)